MKAFLYSLLFLFPLVGKAQCDTKDLPIPDAVIHKANFEVIYQNAGKENNGDYSLGFDQVKASLFSQVYTKNKTRAWGLQLVTRTQPLSRGVIVPRLLVFHFTDGTELEMEATSKSDEGEVHLTTFIFSTDTARNLNKPLDNIEIIDTRQELEFVSTKKYNLYSNVLAEQLHCLWEQH